MDSKIANAIQAKFSPVAIFLTNEKPENAMQFKQGKFGCVMFLFAKAAQGKTAVFDAETYGCWGGGVGLGFGNPYHNFPGGVDCFQRFLSSGNDQSEEGRNIAKAMEDQVGSAFLDDFLYGEGYVKTPEGVKNWLEEIPIMDIGKKYVVFKPLCEVNVENETPEVIVFLANPDQLSALVVLANYERGTIENVSIPWAAGCQVIGIIPFNEAKSEHPRAVVGLTDLSARKNTRAILGSDYLSFAIPWKLFLEMESNVEGSFLEKHVWKSLTKSGDENN